MKKTVLLLIIMVSLGFTPIKICAESISGEFSKAEFFYGISFENIGNKRHLIGTDIRERKESFAGTNSSSASELFYGDTIPDPMDAVNAELSYELQMNKAVVAILFKNPLSPMNFYGYTFND